MIGFLVDLVAIVIGGAAAIGLLGAAVWLIVRFWKCCAIAAALALWYALAPQAFHDAFNLAMAGVLVFVIVAAVVIAVRRSVRILRRLVTAIRWTLRKVQHRPVN